jgi:hypothetical protein
MVESSQSGIDRLCHNAPFWPSFPTAWTFKGAPFKGRSSLRKFVSSCQSSADRQSQLSRRSKLLLLKCSWYNCNASLTWKARSTISQAEFHRTAPLTITRYNRVPVSPCLVSKKRRIAEPLLMCTIRLWGLPIGAFLRQASSHDASSLERNTASNLETVRPVRCHLCYPLLRGRHQACTRCRHHIVWP